MLKGNVSLQQGAQQLNAQHVEYHHDTGALSAGGGVDYTDQDLELHSESITANTLNDTLQTGPATFTVNLQHKSPSSNLSQQGRGKAQSITRTQTGIVRLESVDYTNCPPNDTGWVLSAAEMTLAPDTAVGTAKHVSLSFKGVPFFYFPWFRFVPYR